MKREDCGRSFEYSWHVIMGEPWWTGQTSVRRQLRALNGTEPRADVEVDAGADGQGPRCWISYPGDAAGAE